LKGVGFAQPDWPTNEAILTLPSEHVSLNRLGFEEKIIILVVVIVAVGMWKSALSISKVCGKGGKQHYRFPGFP
jgi:hypothetical protein